ncbi:glutamate-5-semialdehyde dehydrogenase [Candidatus Peregrinibacteria bacterium]|nr:glutamate-5-semialdehyde dehydrogenase [Candidatus Peregrinibacteria bacterium]
MDLKEALKKVKEAARMFVLSDEEVLNAVLLRLAKLLRERQIDILAANKVDLDKMDKDDPLHDRVMLNVERILEMAKSVEEIASYNSPIDILLGEKMQENGLILKKVSVPLGVIGAIFEARPNVLIDTFALCFKARNACIMKGGSQAAETNFALFKLVLEALKSGEAFMKNLAILLSNEREVTAELLTMSDFVDVIIPRGSQELIDYVRKNSLIPLIETGRGVCHTYVDEAADLEKAVAIVFNAKTSRPSVCNALDTLLIHRARIGDLPEICKGLIDFGVEIFADEEAFEVLHSRESENMETRQSRVFAVPGDNIFRAAQENFGMEYMSLKMSVKVASSLEDAISHINHYGSLHSEAIITENQRAAEKFMKAVDAACVYVNASTRFTDGAVFGLGAEIGISTQKLHARGPMGIKELTTYKWKIYGDGQVR